MKLIYHEKNEYNDIASKTGRILAENVDKITFRVLFNLPESVSDEAIEMCIKNGKDIEWLKENYPEELV